MMRHARVTMSIQVRAVNIIGKEEERKRGWGVLGESGRKRGRGNLRRRRMGIGNSM